MNLLSLILMISILESEFKEGENQMTNGFEVLQQDFNYHASIYVNWTYACSGGIIDTIHVITAAHCVEMYKTNEIAIIVGVADLRDDARVLGLVKQMYIPGDFYNNNRRGNDIAVLKLRDPFVFGDDIGVISLTSASVPDEEKICWFTGVDTDRIQADEWKLSWTPLKLISNAVCECMAKSKLPPHAFCASDIRETIRLTNGDSGGVLVCDGVAVGILSARLEDKPLSPNVFCNIYEHLDFIRTVMRFTAN